MLLWVCAFLRRLQLTEQHGQEALNHFLRRVILGCASNTSANSSNGGNALAPSSVLSPTTSSANSVNAAQLPLYNRLLSLETKRLASDPLLAERWVLALVSGLNDPSATCSDVFKALNLQALLNLVGLSNIEERILLAELQLLALSSDSYGPRSVSQAAEDKRQGFGEKAIDLLVEGYQAGRISSNDLTEHIKSAQWSHEQAAKHLGRVASDACLPGGQDVREQPALLLAVETARVVERTYGADTDSIFRSALEYYCQEMQDGSERRSSMETFYRLNQILIDTLPTPSLDLFHAIIERTELVRISSSNAKALADMVSWLLSRLLERPETVPGSLFVQSIDRIAQNKGYAALDWVKIIDNIDSTSVQYPSEGDAKWNAGFMNGVFTAPTTNGQPAMNRIWAMTDEFRQTSYLSVLFQALPSLSASTLPEDEKLIHMPTIHAEVAENQDYSQSVRTAIEAVSAQNENSIWNIKNLLPTLFKLTEYFASNSNDEEAVRMAQVVREMFEHGTRNSPELVLLAILELKVGLHHTFTREEKADSTTFSATMASISI